MRALAISLALTAVILGSTNGLAQTPMPSPQAPTPSFIAWPYRMVVSGPATAHSGDRVAYRVAYDRVNGNEPGAAPAFIFVRPRGEVLTFVSSHVVEGPEGSMEPQTENSVRWGFTGEVAAGAVEVVLQIDTAFTGDMRVGIDVPGTSIVLPDGTVDGLTTTVTAPGALPSTGAGASSSALPVWPAFLALGGVLAVAASGALRFARRTRA